MKKILGILAILMFFAACHGEPAPIDHQGYQVVYEDNFDNLDTSVWNAGTDVDKVSAVDGVLRLTDDQVPGMTAIGSNGPRQSAEPNYPNQLTFQEGYFEARIRYTHNAWAWPIFWLWSASKTEAHPGEDCSRLTGEWDIMENGLDNSSGRNPSYSATHSVLHYNTEDSAQPDGMYCGIKDQMRMIHKDFPNIDLSQWHTWGGKWEGNQLCTYLDGVQIGCMDAYSSTHQPMTLTFSVNYHGICGNCGPRPAQVWMEVDWVKVWQK